MSTWTGLPWSIANSYLQSLSLNITFPPGKPSSSLRLEAYFMYFCWKHFSFYIINACLFPCVFYKTKFCELGAVFNLFTVESLVHSPVPATHSQDLSEYSLDEWSCGIEVEDYLILFLLLSWVDTARQSVLGSVLERVGACCRIPTIDCGTWKLKEEASKLDLERLMEC